MKDIVYVVYVCRSMERSTKIHLYSREKRGLWEEYVTQNSNKPTRCLTRHFNVGMLKKDHHIDQWESSASVLSEL